MLTPLLDAVADAAEQLGWHPAEVVTATLGWVAHRTVDGVGHDVAAQLLEDVAKAMRRQGRR